MYTEDDEKKDFEYNDNYDTDNTESSDSEYEIVNDNDLVNYDIYKTAPEEKKKKKKSKHEFSIGRLVKLLIIFVLLAVLIYLIYLIATTKKLNPRVNILNTEIFIDAGENAAIAYEILDTEERIPLTYTSQDEKIVTVDEYGSIYGVSRGNTNITVSYNINGTKYEETVIVNVQ